MGVPVVGALVVGVVVGLEEVGEAVGAHDSSQHVL